MSTYGISDILSFKELHGGSQNSNYVVYGQDNQYVISICEQNSKKEAQNLAAILEHLKTHSFSTSILLKTDEKEQISNWKGKPVIVKMYIDGLVKDDIPGDIMPLIGIQLGKLHKIQPLPSIPNTPSYGLKYFDEVGLYAADSDFYIWLQDKNKYIEQYISNKLPKTMIHSDVFSSNVIIDAKKEFVTIMDFEEASYYYRIYDVAMTFIGVCREGKGIKYEKARSLLQGYANEVSLTPEEKRCLQAFVVYAATSMAFWRHRNFHYTVPTPSLSDHYKELSDIANTIRNENPQDFLNYLF